MKYQTFVWFTVTSYSLWYGMSNKERLNRNIYYKLYLITRASRDMSATLNS